MGLPILAASGLGRVLRGSLVQPRDGEDLVEDEDVGGDGFAGLRKSKGGLEVESRKSKVEGRRSKVGAGW
jgi:hypothetical protein